MWHRALALAAVLPLAGSIGQAQTAAAADDGQWVRAAKDFAGTRFSGLEQINAGRWLTVWVLSPCWR